MGREELFQLLLGSATCALFVGRWSQVAEYRCCCVAWPAFGAAVRDPNKVRQHPGSQQ